ncbi:Uncharacterised protein [Yersinia enterocolitica]|nr:Uncharacterised protein [Yersinia enterocolitica]
MHLASGDQAIAFLAGGRQVAKHQLHRFLRQRISKITGAWGDIGFQRMGQHVQPGIGGDGRRHGDHQRRVQNGNVRVDRIVKQRIFNAFFRVTDHASAGDF